MIRAATAEDVSRIAAVVVFVRRVKFRPIFQDDGYSFGELQVLPVAERYADPAILAHIHVFDDGIVKGFIHIEGAEIVTLYVDSFFWNQGSDLRSSSSPTGIPGPPTSGLWRRTPMPSASTSATAST